MGEEENDDPKYVEYLVSDFIWNIWFGNQAWPPLDMLLFI